MSAHISEIAAPAIDIHNETLLTDKEAAATLPTRNGVKIHGSAICRWRIKGKRLRDGSVIRLEFVRISDRCFTTPAALNRFCNRVAQASVARQPSEQQQPPQQPKQSPTRREREIEATQRELAAEGVS